MTLVWQFFFFIIIPKKQLHITHEAWKVEENGINFCVIKSDSHHCGLKLTLTEILMLAGLHTDNQ